MNPSTVLLFAIFFASGAVGLVYEVLWMRQLSLVLGQTTYAASATLAAFFLGMAAGNYVWGDRAARAAHPLRLYALLELGIAAAAGVTLLVLHAYGTAYPWLFQHFASHPTFFLALKCVLAMGAIFPAALFMGGTLPVVGQYLIRSADQLGRVATALYAVNTIGGAVGAFAAGFYLPITFGFRRAYVLAMGSSVLIAAAAYVASLRAAPPASAPAHVVPRPQPAAPLLSMRALLLLGLVSGFVALGLEVVWTRMFAQVLHNSVYSFSIILVTFLVALALGAALAHVLSRTNWPPLVVLFVVLALAGIGVGLTPFVFTWVTDGLSYVAPQEGWSVYVRSVFLTAAAVMLLPTIVLGAVFPYLLRVAAGMRASAGQTLGRIGAANTLGSIAGSLIAGFLLLEWLGIWASVRTFALLYLLAALLLAEACPTAWRVWLRTGATAGVVLLMTLLDPSRLPVVRVAAGGREVVHQSWESQDAVVAVVRGPKNLRIKVDNYYSLGGSGSRNYEETQADIPIFIHPRPRSVFFLGLGTGITAGAALRHPVERVTAVELLPDVVTASREYFAPYINNLFEDERVRVVVEDGRNYLLGTDERYDVIVSDLFIPWQAGAGSLYTREQYEIIKRRMADGGVFAQWLALYQLSQREFFTIVHTMLDVFPQVTLWRADFSPDRPIVAVVGETAARPLDVDALVQNFRNRRQSPSVSRETVLGLLGLFYVGNLSANRDLFAAYPINSDDRPIIEYSAPITQREERVQGAAWFTGVALAEWETGLQQALPPARDPYLARLSERERDFVSAGMALFDARVYAKANRQAEAQAAADRFRALVPPEIAQMFQRQLEPPAKKTASGS